MSSMNTQRFAGNTRPVFANSLRTPSLDPRSPVEGELKFTLTFEPTTPMERIQDRVIELVLGFTNGNRKLAGQLLGINPRTIRRRLGRKSGSADAITSVA